MIYKLNVLKAIKTKITLYLYPKRYKRKISTFVREKRNAAKLTQPELAEKAGVGLRFLRELEQGKETLRLDKVNQVLQLFGYERVEECGELTGGEEEGRVVGDWVGRNKKIIYVLVK